MKERNFTFSNRENPERSRKKNENVIQRQFLMLLLPTRSTLCTSWTIFEDRKSSPQSRTLLKCKSTFINSKLIKYNEKMENLGIQMQAKIALTDYER